MRLTDPVWIAALGGYFDGEGCIRVDRGRVKVSVSNTYLPKLENLQAVLGGSVRLKRTMSKQHRPCYEWNLNGAEALRVVRLLRPYLEEKAYQADLILKYQDFPPRSAARTRIENLLTKAKNVSYWKA